MYITIHLDCFSYDPIVEFNQPEMLSLLTDDGQFNSQSFYIIDNCNFNKYVSRNTYIPSYQEVVLYINQNLLKNDYYYTSSYQSIKSLIYRPKNKPPKKHTDFLNVPVVHLVT